MLALPSHLGVSFLRSLPDFDEALMRACLTVLRVVLIATLSLTTSVTAQQAKPAAQPTAEQQQAYATFRAWFAKQPPDVQRAPDAVVFERYAAELKAQGKSDQEVASTIQTLIMVGDRAEIEFWNRILTAPKPRFNTAPNAFLAEMIKGLKPGRALDVGMGQGRNTIYLAQQGWESVGFDPADRAVASAQEQATKLGVKITTHVARAEDFDWGESAWDLIVLSYVGGRDHVDKVQRALRPGGMVVIEGFHRDATKTQPIGPAVVFDTNELLQLFAALRVVRYEDTKAVGDFLQNETRVVRLAAVKR
jgi:2-polyprenyl-3-methyl-5-hydroxy-6-metoxy-1,4-benzoquinol methylase